MGFSSESAALSMLLVVEIVTLRAPVASPIRMTGSFVSRTTSGSISGTDTGSLAEVVGHSAVARRGRVAGCPSCALEIRLGETRAQVRSAAVKSLLKEERIAFFVPTVRRCVCASVDTDWAYVTTFSKPWAKDFKTFLGSDVMKQAPLAHE